MPGKWAPENSHNCTCAANWYQNGTYLHVQNTQNSSSSGSLNSNSTQWAPDDFCVECPEGTESHVSNNTSGEKMLRGIDACACPAGFAAPHSLAGQTGCGHNPCCGQPCPATTTPIPVPMEETTTTTPSPVPTTTPAPVGNSYCVDGNECAASALADWLGSPYMPHRCHANATCINTYASYNCQCSQGTYGNGLDCAMCPAFSTSDTAATSVSQCRCDAGVLCVQ